MLPVRIFRHMSCEGPGLLAALLDRRGIAFEVFAVGEKAGLPSTVNDVSAMVFLGGPESAPSLPAWNKHEYSLVQQAVQAGLPLLGQGYGAEIIASALGASVVPAIPQIGWFPVRRLDNPLSVEWLHGVPDEFEVFCWHSRAFGVPAGATPILAGEWSVNSGFVHGDTLALQCHLQMTEDMVRSWVATCADQIYSPSGEVHAPDDLVVNWESVIQGADMITLNLPRRIRALNTVAETIYGRWLDKVLRDRC